MPRRSIETVARASALELATAVLVVRTNFREHTLTVYTCFQHQVTGLGQEGVNLFDDCDYPRYVLDEVGHHFQQFGRLITVGVQQADVLSGHNTHVVMERVGGIEEQGYEPYRGEYDCDLASHYAALVQTGAH